MAQLDYNTRNIRKLLTEAFDDKKLREICADIPEFRPVLEEFSSGMSKSDMIFRLIDHCRRHVLMDQLLQVVQEENPRQYALFADSLIVSGNQVEPKSSSISTAMPDEAEIIQKRIVDKTRQLHILQLQEAKFGISTPPHVLIQIEDLEKEIAELEQKLKTKS